MEVKMVILVRTDLGMRAGKIAAQVAHAAVCNVVSILDIGQQLYASGKDNKKLDVFDEWYDSGFYKKVALRVSSEAELKHYYELALQADLPCSLIKDAGLTQIPADSYTTCAIGPWYADEIDKICGKLKLL